MPNANWSNPTLTSTYTNFVSEVKNRDEDLALQFDGTTSTNIPTGTIRWDSSANRWKKWTGAAWGELTSTYALTALTTTGNVGIGTTSPTSLLHVDNSPAGTQSARTLLSSSNSADTVACEIRQGRFNKDVLVVSSNQSLSANLFNAIENGTSRFVITGAGNVGIGTTSPGSPLEVSGGAIRSTDTAGNARSRIEVFTNGQSNNQVTLGQGFGAPTDNIGYLYNRANASLVLGTNDQERLRIDSSGRVGIGTSSPGYKLTVQSDSTDTSFSTPYNNYGINIRNDDQTNNNYSGFSFNTKNSAGADNTVASIAAQCTNHTSGATNGTLAFFTTGSGTVTERMRIDSSGRVGIGTTSPGYALDTLAGSGSAVAARFRGNGGANNNTQIRFYGNNAATDQWAIGGSIATSDTGRDFHIYDLVANANRFAINSSGNVGIGTTAGVGKLTVFTSTTYTPGNNYNDGCLLVGNGTATTGNLAISYNDTDGAAFTSLVPGTAWKDCSFGGNQLKFSTGGNERARIDSSGRLLVGTSSAYGPYPAILQTQNNNGFAALFGKYSNNSSGPDVEFFKGRGGSASVRGIVQNGDQLGYIAFSGDDGTNGSVSGASIQAAVDGTPGANDMPGRLVFSTTADGASSPTERMRISHTGNISMCGALSPIVGAGNTSTGIGFENSSDGGTGFFSRDNNTPLYVNRNTDGVNIDLRRSGTNVGTIAVTESATAYNTSSDYRLKENVTAVTDGITRLQQLKPSRFNFKVEPGKTVDGFIAHEVQTVVPEAITGTKDAVDADGNPIYQGIDQSKLVPLLTAALQEAVERIEQVKTEKAEQQTVLDDLLARVAALESA